MLTTDRNDPNLNKVKENGQNESYLVLSEEEKAKGFIRPVRDSYIHRGINWNKIPHEVRKSNNGSYAAVLYHVKDETGKFIGGRYIKQNELTQLLETGFTDGCGTLTKMADRIAETYARDPKFYGATYCAGCGKHLPVSEFIWKNTNEEVGS